MPPVASVPAGAETGHSIPYLPLREPAGHPDALQLAAAEAHRVGPKPHPLAGQKLNPGEWKQVGAFIRELVAARGPPAGEPETS